jgi:transposase-like protein
MTHTRQMNDDEGKFEKWKETKTSCRYCNSPHVQYRIWESSCGGYEDYQYKCAECQRVWWIDGIDS